MTTTTPEVPTTAAPRVTAAAGDAHKKLTSPWASLAAAVIAILWTIPTLGLLITSFRPESDITSSGWWTFFTNPNVTMSNYDEVLHGSDT